MFRDGLLSPRSKLLPQSLKQPSYPDLVVGDRSKSVLSIASTGGFSADPSRYENFMLIRNGSRNGIRQD